MSAVLHTRGQNLSQHVHLHCLVPGGALAARGHWKATKGDYPFPCGRCRAASGARW